MSIRGKLLAVHFYLAFLGTAYILYKKGEVLSNTTSLVYEASLLPLRPAIEKKVSNLGLSQHVIFAGLRADIPALMRGVMDVFVFPSLYEGLGIVLLEAQAASLPCVISDVVPEEADITTRSVKRMSLENHSPSVWADVVLQLAQIKPSLNRKDALSFDRFRQFDINTSVEALVRIYHGAV